MKLVILTSGTKGAASRVLPELCKNQNLEIMGVVLAHGVSPNRKKNLKRKIKKTLKIGVLGALNGLRLRTWYADSNIECIHQLCQRLDVTLIEVPHINGIETENQFRNFDADLGLSLGNGYIRKSIFSIPKYGMINIHTEILPDFQGAQSIIWPIYENRKETGFTIHQIDANIDTGEILFKEKYPIEFSTSLENTVRQNLETSRSKIPTAFSYVCENYKHLKNSATLQTPTKSYTTPSIWQFMRMVKNNMRFYNEKSRTKNQPH